MAYPDKCFWCSNSQHQDTYKSLLDLVPDSGTANTLHGELLRVAVNAYYDHFNNGGCNMRLGRKDDGMTLRRFVGFFANDVRAAMRQLSIGSATHDEAELAMEAVVMFVAAWQHNGILESKS